MIETHSPYFLRPFEGPGAPDHGCDLWGEKLWFMRKSNKSRTQSQKQIRVYRRHPKEPVHKEGDDELELQAWEMANSMICSWILNVIEPKLRTSIAYVKTAYLSWITLRRGMPFPMHPRYVNSRQILSNASKKGTRRGILFGTNGWSELQNQVRFPWCSCGNIDHLPSLDKIFNLVHHKIFNLVHQEENHKNLPLNRNGRAKAVRAFAVTGKVAQTRTDMGTCSHCESTCMTSLVALK